MTNKLKENTKKYINEAGKLNQDLDRKANNIQRKVNNMYETQKQDGKVINMEEEFIRKIHNLKKIELLEIKMSITLKMQQKVPQTNNQTINRLSDRGQGQEITTLKYQ